MSINFFTIIVQIFNFLILLLVLNKVLYKPLMKAIEDRRKLINEKINNAEQKLLEAEQLKKELLSENENFKKHKNEEIDKINIELSNYETNEMKKLKHELEDEKKIFIQKFENEKEETVNKISNNICAIVGNFVNNILVSLSNQNLKEESFKIFLEEIKNLKEFELNKIKSSENEEIKFISSFDISANNKEKVKETFKNLNVNNNICFEIDESIIFGNKIIIDNLIINSNIKNIIEQFNNNLKEIV